MNNNKDGLAYGILAYVLWGVLPLYWKLLDHVSPGEVLAHRIFWAFITMIIFLWITNRMHSFTTAVKALKKEPKKLTALLAVSLFISINWLLFIWSVSSGHIVESSLGYYINPLISIVLGVAVLKEKLTRSHIIAFGLALAGVVFLTVAYGQFPWISFALALSFGLYGLVKKILDFDAAIGLTMETMAVTPVALVYILISFLNGRHSMGTVSAATDWTLILSGAVTAIPLLLFAKGVQRLPLYLMGFLQYIAPTMMLFLGVFLYNEPFGSEQFISFAFIWAALVIVSLSSIRWSRSGRLKHAQEKRA